MTNERAQSMIEALCEAVNEYRETLAPEAAQKLDVHFENTGISLAIAMAMKSVIRTLPEA